MAKLALLGNIEVAPGRKEQLLAALMGLRGSRRVHNQSTTGVDR
jgi:hypothetical protein